MLKNTQKAFTVVELLIVIVVIAILAAVGTAAYRGLQARATNTELQSDASNLSERLELAFIKSKKYPATLSELGQIAKDTTTNISYSANDISYCLTVSSTKSGQKSYTIRDNQKLQEGSCSGWVAAAPAGGGGSGGGSGGGGSTFSASDLPAPSPITPCAASGGGGNFGWPSPPASQIPYFAVSENGYEEQMIDNNLSSQGTFIYDGPGQGAQGYFEIMVQYVDANGDRSEPGYGSGTFYGDCYGS